MRLSVSLMYLARAGWGRRLCWRWWKKINDMLTITKILQRGAGVQNLAWLLTDLITYLFQNRWLQIHTLKQCSHNATPFPCLEITQLLYWHIWTCQNHNSIIKRVKILFSAMWPSILLTPLLPRCLWEQGSHLHQSCCVNMGILATETPFSDTVAFWTEIVGRGSPLEYRPLVLRAWVTKQRLALLLATQVGEHDYNWKRNSLINKKKYYVLLHEPSQ